MKNLFTLYPNELDATCFYRGYGPLNHMRRNFTSDWLNFQKESKFNPAIAAASDGVFMQRPYAKSHFQAADIAHHCNRPIWIDYDDNLFRVPSDNNAHELYMRSDIQNYICAMTAVADWVTVSTPGIEKMFIKKVEEYLKKNKIKIQGGAFPKFKVIPNAFNGDLVRPRKENKRMVNKRVVWRGSITHQRDLWTYENEMARVLKEFASKGWEWQFIGYCPNRLADLVSPHNITYTPGVTPNEFFYLFQRTMPSIVIVPLHDSEFNHCKSNIAWIEAMYAGAVCLAPDWEEWRVPGCVRYKDKKDFEIKLSEMIKTLETDSGKETFSSMNEEGWNHVLSNYSLDVVNKKRVEVAECLLKKN